MKKFEILILIIALAMSASSAQAAIYNNGTVNDISSAITGSVTVNDNISPPPLTTTVNLKKHAAIQFSLNAYDSSIVYMWDGSVGTDLSTSDTSTANILGGTIGGNLYVWETSTVNIYGQNFNYPIGTISAASGNITGTLHKGDLLDLDFARLDDRTRINLIEAEIVPLPGAVLLGGLGLITAGWRLRKRKTA